MLRQRLASGIFPPSVPELDIVPRLLLIAYNHSEPTIELLALGRMRVPCVFRRIRISDHHFLLVVNQLSIAVDGQQSIDHVARTVQIIECFEQWDDLQHDTAMPRSDQRDALTGIVRPLAISFINSATVKTSDGWAAIEMMYVPSASSLPSRPIISNVSNTSRVSADHR